MSEEKKNKQIKSKDRVADKGEVFTNQREVNAMLDMVKPETERVDSRFLEPACGNGNFVTEILRRKLEASAKMATPSGRKKVIVSEYEKQAVLAIGCIYGIDIMMDNIIECRERLLKIWLEKYKEVCKKDADAQLIESVKFIISRNITCGNTLSMKQVNEKAEDIDLPIIISEWSYVIGTKMQRKDYRYDVLVNEKLPNNELSDEYIKNERNYLKGYVCEYREVQKYA